MSMSTKKRSPKLAEVIAMYRDVEGVAELLKGKRWTDDEGVEHSVPGVIDVRKRLAEKRKSGDKDVPVISDTIVRNAIIALAIEDGHDRDSVAEFCGLDANSVASSVASARTNLEQFGIQLPKGQKGKRASISSDEAMLAALEGEVSDEDESEGDENDNG